jgi:hypothetical protein
MTLAHDGLRRTLAFGGGFLAGCAIARMAMRALRPPAARRRGAAT